MTRQALVTGCSIRRVRHQALPGFRCDFSGCGFLSEATKAMHLSLYSYLNSPLLPACIPVDVSVLGCCSALARCVLGILSTRADPEIAPAVVQTVPVPVIDFRLIANGKTEQGSMQTDHVVATDPFVTDRIATVAQAPPPLVSPVGVSRINDGVSTDRAITSVQGNLGRKTVLAQRVHGDVGCSFANVRTARGTVGAGFRGDSCEHPLTRQAGKMYGHRPSPVGGVTPPDVHSIAGVSCRPNCSTSYLVAA